MIKKVLIKGRRSVTKQEGSRPGVLQGKRFSRSLQKNPPTDTEALAP